MKLEDREKNVLKDLQSYLKQMYGEKWETVLESSAVMMPEEGLDKEISEFLGKEVKWGKEEVYSLIEKGFLLNEKKQVEETSTSIEDQNVSGSINGISTDKFAHERKEKEFLGIEEGRIEQLKEELNL